MKKRLFVLLLLIPLFIFGCEMESSSKPDEEVLPYQLDRPNLVLVGEELKWEAIEYAKYYRVYVDDELASAGTATSFSLTRYVNAEFLIKVQAVSGNEAIKDSEFAYYKYESYPDKGHYQILMINDTHGSFVDDYTPGLARVSSIINEVDQGHLIKVANGDIFQGSYVSNVLQGAPLIDAMNAMEFDCFVIGNHDFDWGLDVVYQYADGDPSNGEANFPFLGANIIDKRTGERVDWLDAYTVVDVGNAKVGIIGLIGYELESSILSTRVEDYDFVYPVSIVRDCAKELRTELGCDQVIVSIHDYDEALNQTLASLSGVYAIDGILCGHSHQQISTTLTRSDNKQIPIVQNRDKNRTVTVVDYDLENPSFVVSQYNPFDYQPDYEIISLENKYQATIDEGNRVLGSTSYLSKSVLGHYATDLMADKYDVDMAIINTGGIRATISNGQLTVADVFEVFPFDNQVITLTMKGSTIKELYRDNADYLYFNTSFNINNINNDGYYDVAVIDYVFFNPYYEEFNGVEYYNTTDILRDLLVDYLDELY